MEIKFTISVDDLEVIQNSMDYFVGLFPRFKIVSDNLMVDDQRFTEYTGEAGMFDFKEVVFELDNINNLWAMAKFVQMLKIENL